MGKIFKSSYFISFFLATVLALLVWFLPALVGIESLFEVAPRWWIIAGLFTLCFLFWGIRFWINRRRNQAAIEGLNQINEANVVDEQSERIKDKHKKVLEILKKENFPLADTPHYIIIGPPASGKTTILENSQLKEPPVIRRSMPNKEKNSDGGTRDFDWWITEEAVLIDTAGRYFGESNPDQAKSEKTEKQWRNFLEVLRKTRSNEPINGVLITFDIHDLLTQSPTQINQHITNIQQHLHELDELLGVRYPIYFLFTKLDLIAGFNQYFSELEKRQVLLDQVWGFTFDLEEIKESGLAKFKSYFSGSMDKVNSDSQHFSKEFDSLIKRLNDGVLANVANTNNMRNKELIYRFPQEFNLAKEKLEDFIGSIFKSSLNYEPVLRGVYFTSGTQTGSPLERVMTQYANSLQLDIGSLSESYEGEGRSFFINQLLKGVVFKEKNLVSFGRGHLNKLSYRLLSASIVTFSALVLAYGIWFWPVSAGENSDNLDSIQSKIEAYKSHKPSPEEEINKSNFKGVLPPLQNAYDASVVFNLENDPDSMHQGLYQGESFTNQQFYQRALNRVFLRHMALYLMEKMQNIYNNANEASLYAEVSPVLEAYLMIKKSEKEHFNQERFNLILTEYWKMDAEIGQDLQVKLTEHLARLKVTDFIEEDEIDDKDFIGKLRAKLLIERSITDRLYDSIQNEARESGIDDFGLESPEAKDLFIPREGYELPIVAGLYTAEQGYCDFFKNYLGSSIADEMARMNWLLNNKEKTPLQSKLTSEYAKNYIKAWKTFLGDLRTKEMNSTAEVSDRLYSLSNPDSALKKLMENVKNNTDVLLSCSAAADELEDKACKKDGLIVEEVSRLSGKLNKMKGLKNKACRDKKMKRQKVPPEVKTIRAAFKDMNGLDIKKLDDILKEVKKALDSNADNTDKVLADLGRQINGALGGTGSNSAARDIKRMLDNVKDVAEKKAASGKSDRTKNGLNEAWTNILGDCRAMEGSYPPKKNVSQGSFEQFFGVGGTLDNFEKQHFDSAKSSLKKLQRPALFEQAKYLREAFFDGKRLSVHFSLQPIGSANIGSAIFSYAGQDLIYIEGEPSLPKSFDWPNNTQPLLVLKLQNGESAEVTNDGSNWAIFNFIRKAKNKNSTLTFSGRGGASIEYELKVTNVQNPFEKKVTISCPEKII